MVSALLLLALSQPASSGGMKRTGDHVYGTYQIGNNLNTNSASTVSLRVKSAVGEMGICAGAAGYGHGTAQNSQYTSFYVWDGNMPAAKCTGGTRMQAWAINAASKRDGQPATKFDGAIQFRGAADSAVQDCSTYGSNDGMLDWASTTKTFRACDTSQQVVIPHMRSATKVPWGQVAMVQDKTLRMNTRNAMIDTTSLRCVAGVVGTGPGALDVELRQIDGGLLYTTTADCVTGEVQQTPALVLDGGIERYDIVRGASTCVLAPTQLFCELGGNIR